MSVPGLTPEVRQKYNAHKHSAKQRGVEFDLTLEEWWEIWSGHIEKRGRERGCLQMCRTGDAGGYTAGNVRIDTVEANQKEKLAVLKAKDVEFRRENQSDWLDLSNRHFMSYTKMRRLMEENPELLDDGS